MLFMKFENSVPLWYHLYGRHDWWPPFLFWMFKWDLTMTDYVQFNEFLTVWYILHGLLDGTVTLSNILLSLL